MARLVDLPVEIIQEILLLAPSDALAFTCRYLHDCLFSADCYFQARFLAHIYPKKTLEKALKHPVCTLPVLHSLERNATRKLELAEMPKELVMGLSKDRKAARYPEFDLELIEYVFKKYKCSPNTKNGYLLGRAVVMKHYPLMKLLLKYHADPSLNDGWAVRTAIKKGHSEIVRLLLEDVDEPCPGEEGDICVKREPERSENENEGGDSILRSEGRGSQHGTELRPQEISPLAKPPQKASKLSNKRRLNETNEEVNRKHNKKLKTSLRCKPTSSMIDEAFDRKNYDMANYLSSLGATPSIAALNRLR